ncbi:sensor domain-containing protein [Afifella pfennigii]|uniref:sensor domain-containing protein n=1 Tax=Afifella pfennigii TaxID=209897 RepID=UPI0012EBACD0|nr:diguanylate cyclase [Afifella pfennigii]
MSESAATILRPRWPVSPIVAGSGEIPAPGPSLFDQDVIGVAQLSCAQESILRCNRRFAEMLGHERESVVGAEKIFDGWESAEGRWSEQLAALASGEIDGFAVEMHMNAGEQPDIWLSLQATMATPLEGGGRAFILIANDISDHKRMAKALREAETKFRDIYENISEGVYRSSPDGRQLAANPSLVRLNGYYSEEEMLASVRDIGREWYVDPHRRAEFQRILFEKGRVEGFISEIYRHKTRERIWVEENARLVRDETSGEPLYFEGTVREVTATVQQLMLHDRLQKIGAVICACPFQFRLHPDGHMAMPYAGLGLQPLFGVAPETVREDASDLLARVHEEDHPKLEQSLARSAARMTPWILEFRVNHPERGTIWISGRAVPDREGDGSILWHGFISDVTALKSSERQIYELAYFDSLTGLPNRQMLRDRLNMALASSRRKGDYGSLLFIDLDNFKLINDTYGHDVGDLLLVSIAQRLRHCLRETDTVARLGGDEFVVLLPDLGDCPREASENAEAVARKVLQAIDQPCLLNGKRFQTTCSVGLTLVEGTCSSSDEVLKRADLAMYEAKGAGRNALRFFSPQMQKVVIRRVEAVTELRRALDHDAIGFRIQGQYDADGHCRGAELLAHWQRDRATSMPAEELAVLAEEGGLGESLSRCLMKEACRILQRWAGDPVLGQLVLAVNISPRLLSEPGLARYVVQLLQESGVDPSRIKLELPEAALGHDLDVAAQKMGRLRKIGVRFSLSEFTTGLTALSSKDMLPFDELKIAPSHVHAIGSEEGGLALARTILRIARGMNLNVTAAGIRSQAQVDVLAEGGCGLFQGDFLAASAPLASFEETLQQSIADRSRSPRGPCDAQEARP